MSSGFIEAIMSSRKDESTGEGGKEGLTISQSENPADRPASNNGKQQSNPTMVQKFKKAIGVDDRPSAEVDRNTTGRPPHSSPTRSKLDCKVDELWPKNNQRYTAEVVIVYLYCGAGGPKNRRLSIFDYKPPVHEARDGRTSFSGSARPTSTKAIEATPAKAKEVKLVSKKDQTEATKPAQPGNLMPPQPESAKLVHGEAPKSTQMANHQLNSDNTTSFERFNWLEDERTLRKLLPDAKVMAAGIDIQNTLDSAIDLAMAASMLEDKITLKPPSPQNLPLLFIGHGFGGTVVQKMLLNGTQTPAASVKAKALLDRTAALVLFSCPISNSDDNRSIFAQTSGAPKNKQVFGNMNAKSGKIKSLWEDFNEKVVLTDKWTDSTSLIRSALDTSSPPSGFPVLHCPPRVKKQAVESIETKDFGRLLEDKSSPNPMKTSSKPSGKTAKQVSDMVSTNQARPLGEGASELVTTNDDARLALFSSADDSAFRSLSHFLTWAALSRIFFYVADDPEPMKKWLKRPKFVRDFRDVWGQSVLHMAVLRKNNAVLQELLRTYSSIDSTLDASPKNVHLDTPLHYAIHTKVPELVRTLLDFNAETGAMNARSQTPKKLAEQISDLPPKIQEYVCERRGIKGKRFGIVACQESPKREESTTHQEVCESFDIAVAEIHTCPPEERDEDSRNGTNTSNSGEPNQHWRLTWSVEELIYKDKSIAEIFGDQRDTLVCRWIHVDQNNMTWITDLFKKLGYSGNLFPGLGDQSEIDVNLLSSSAFTKDRTVDPHMTILPKHDEKDGLMAISVPFVGYDVNTHQEGMANCIRKVQRTVSPRTQSGSTFGGTSNDDTEMNWERLGLINGVSDKELALLRAYLCGSSKLHVRRTLDQHYYHMLRSTKKRDQDQVVSRWAKKHLFGVPPRVFRRRLQFNFNDYPPHNILMVDQLWIWKFRKEGIDYVVSCFPDSKGVNTSKDDTLRDLVLDPSQDIAPIRSSLDLVYRIIGTCSNVFDRCQDIKELRFLQMFEESIGSASHDESKLFTRFKKRLQRFADLKGQSADSPEMKKLMDDSLDIREETDLVAEVKDILDEVNIILTVVKTQETILEDIYNLKKKDDEDKLGIEEHHKITKRVISTTKKVFERMQAQATVIKNALDTLLDLNQNSLMVFETHVARQGADETRKQGLTMTVFTSVTILFLPLSFMTSFFALDINSFPQDPKSGETSWPLSQISRYIFGISAPIIILLFVLGFDTRWTYFFKICVNVLRNFSIILLQIAVISPLIIFAYLSEIFPSYSWPSRFCERVSMRLRWLNRSLSFWRHEKPLRDLVRRRKKFRPERSDDSNDSDDSCDSDDTRVTEDSNNSDSDVSSVIIKRLRARRRFR